MRSGLAESHGHVDGPKGERVVPVCGEGRGEDVSCSSLFGLELQELTTAVWDRMGTMESDEKLVFDQIKDSGNRGALAAGTGAGGREGGADAVFALLLVQVSGPRS